MLGPLLAVAACLALGPVAVIATVFVRGTTNAVNALAAIDRLVFVERRMTLVELATAL